MEWISTTGLRILPVLDSDEIMEQPVEELPAYIVAAEDAQVDDDFPRLKWWEQQTRLPGRQQATKMLFSLLPSSAPAERVFSLLDATVSSRQACLLEDHLEATLALQYNCGRKAMM